MRQSTRLIFNSLVSLGQQAINIGLQIYLLRFVLLRVGTDEYGVFLLALGAQNVIYTLRDSISKGVVTHIAAAVEKLDSGRLDRILSTAIVLQTFPSLVASAFVMGMSGSIAAWFCARSDLQETMKAVVWYTAMNMLCVMPMFSFRSLLEGLQRYDLIAGIETVSRIARMVIIVLCFQLLKASVVYVVVAALITDVSAQIAMLALAYRKARGLKIRVRRVDKAIMTTMCSYGLFVFLASLAAAVGTDGVKWMIGKLVSVSAVTELGIALYVATIIKMCVQTFTLAMVPVASRFQANDDQARLRQMFLLSCRYATIAACLPVVVLAPTLGSVLSLWLMPEIARIAPYTLLIGVFAALSASSDCGDQILSGMGRVRTVLFVILGSTVVILVTTLLCWMLGNRGYEAAVAGVCAGLFVKTCAMLVCVRGQIAPSIRLFVRTTLLPPVLAAIPSVGVGFILTRGKPIQSWSSIIIYAGVSAFVYGLSLLPWLLPQEKNQLAGGLRAAVRAIWKSERRPLA